MKIKIGTQLEEEVFQDLKVAAARENKPISELIQVAVVTYLNQQNQPRAVKSGLRRFLEQPPMNISDEDFREILDADYYDQ
jgi:hypothetical protein